MLLIAIGVAIYLLLALLTYSSLDRSFSNTGSGATSTNFSGPIGAWFADIAFMFVGSFAYLLPVMVVALGLQIYRRKPKKWSHSERLRVLAGFIFIFIAGCGLEHLHYAASASSTFVAGGLLGGAVAGIAADLFGFVGTSLLLVIIFLVGVTWFTRLSWFLVMDKIGALVCNNCVRILTWWQQRNDRKRGTEIRQLREQSVKQQRHKQETKTPPRIEPRIEQPESSQPLVHNQVSLFEQAPVADTLPSLVLLEKPDPKTTGYSRRTLEKLSALLEKKLSDFNIKVDVVAVHPGPVITRFEVEPAPGIKASQITTLSKDLARALSMVSIRVVENIPGKTTIGIELPNENREVVRLIEGLTSVEYERSQSPLTLVLGKDISGETIVADLAKMPHILIAGTTGSGKSVCINALILSLLYKSTPSTVRLIMIDPKMLELSVYEDIPHLLAPVVTDMQQAANALRWCIIEMEQRYRQMSSQGVRNISGFNRKVKAACKAGQPIPDPLASGEGEPEYLQELPFIVVVIDELADLMMVVGKKVEELITRIAQRARAAGIHLVLATQRPSVDVITGLLKANIPTRISFQVSSRVDSRTILDQMGAEQLLGLGDMLYIPPNSSVPERIHGSFVSDQEVNDVASFLKKTSAPQYVEAVLEGMPEEINSEFLAAGSSAEDDPLYDSAVQFVTQTRRASISAVQRQLRVGYNRAARMIETMENCGVVGPLESNGRRNVLAPPPVE